MGCFLRLIQKGSGKLRLYFKKKEHLIKHDFNSEEPLGDVIKAYDKLGYKYMPNYEKEYRNENM